MMTARSAREPISGQPSPLTFSLVVPMRNEAAYVEETLRSLLTQDYPQDKFEIMVVDGCSSDASRDIVISLMQEHPNIRLLNNQKVRSSAGRNVGIRAARGRFIGVVDCHSFVRRDLLQIAERLFEEKGVDCLGRPVELFISGDRYLQRAIGAARTSWLGHNPISPRYRATQGAISPLSVGILYRREVFDRVGLFNEEMDACEDVEFNSRLEQAGLKTWTDPAMCAYYHPRGSLSALFKQMRRYAYWRFRLLRAQRRAFHLSQAAPALGLGCEAVALAAAAAGALPMALPLGLAALYLGLVALASVRASLRRGFRYLPVLPLVYGIIHAGVAAGFFASAFEEARRVLTRSALALMTYREKHIA